MTMNPASGPSEVTYNDGIVRKFAIASVIWGIVGMLLGLIVALELSFWQVNLETSWLSFGRLRPLHTNAAIFALVGNMIFAGVYYSTQRLCKVRLASDMLSSLHFWLYQFIIVCAAITLPLGMTQAKEYAELEWWIDILVVLVWVVFAINFFWTLAVRNEKNLYVAIWFYIATICAIALLYIVNNLSLPISMTKSYSIFGGAQDALTQWWYGHNAVAFFLTTPILGIMYYYLPKAAGRPVYSYRLSVIHFWALVFIYIWAGPHHLLYTALPDWAQSLGMIFSLMLWAPSWGGMLNGLLTLRGAWDKVRTDPVLKFFVAAVTFYGMSTFEGPLLSVKSVNALAHYNDWIIGHVHGGTLGWNGFMAAGMFYWLFPRLWGTKLHSKTAADYHFWIGTIGILLYMASMWVAGITQGMHWNAVTPDGALQYPNWIQIVEKTNLLYIIRAIGGALYLGGWLLMGWNLLKTVKSGKAVDGQTEVTRWEHAPGTPGAGKLIFGLPFVVTVVGLLGALMMGLGETWLRIVGILVVVGVVVWSIALYKGMRKGESGWHSILEGRPLAFTVLVLLGVAAGGVVELVPGLLVQKAVPAGGATPHYSPLELAGRDLYIREGCFNCHSQMIRPFVSETIRFGGEPSKLEESQFDHPFLWGSRRIGPDLAHEGILRPDGIWHYKHMRDPRSTSPGSNMPSYKWLYTGKIDRDGVQKVVKAMRTLGVPYSNEQIEKYRELYDSQAKKIVADLAKGNSGIQANEDDEIVALIAYLLRLGKTTEPIWSGH